jgi:Na+-transporting methylmalonyl-CoA/oxaloacetate decarboxylase beta subunit
VRNRSYFEQIILYSANPSVSSQLLPRAGSIFQVLLFGNRLRETIINDRNVIYITRYGLHCTIMYHLDVAHRLISRM